MQRACGGGHLVCVCVGHVSSLVSLRARAKQDDESRALHWRVTGSESSEERLTPTFAAASFRADQIASLRAQRSFVSDRPAENTAQSAPWERSERRRRGEKNMPSLHAY